MLRFQPQKPGICLKITCYHFIPPKKPSAASQNLGSLVQTAYFSG